MEIQQMLRQVWPDWQIVRKLGEGSYGTVYHAQRRDIVGNVDAAIKVTRVPRTDSEHKALRMEGMNEVQARTYLEGVVRDMAAEIRAMESVKGYTNIVSIEDYKIIEQKASMTWYIFIRMELLTPLDQRQKQRPLSEAEVIRLGRDLCTALSVCRNKSIVHRDIKPENIFVNEQGDYVLGDFGVARNMDRLTGGMTRIGTYNYMSPELFNNTIHSADVDSAARMDIYSLGLVMYQLMNYGRLPLMQDPATMTPQGRQDAVLRRLRGDALPKPPQASKGLAIVILTACAYDPNKRYASADAMRQALSALESGQPVWPEPEKPGRPDNGTGIDRAYRSDAMPKAQKAPKPAKPKGRRMTGKALLIAAIATVFLLGLVAIITLFTQPASDATATKAAPISAAGTSSPTAGAAFESAGKAVNPKSTTPAKKAAATSEPTPTLKPTSAKGLLLATHSPTQAP